jgi:hypothetical protein
LDLFIDISNCITNSTKEKPPDGARLVGGELVSDPGTAGVPESVHETVVAEEYSQMLWAGGVVNHHSFPAYIHVGKRETRISEFLDFFFVPVVTDLFDDD